MPNSTKRQILADIQTEFKTLLQTKTSWGKNDVFVLYLQAQTTVLAKYALPS